MGIFDQEFHVLQPRTHSSTSRSPRKVVELKEMPLICHEADADSTWKGGNRHGHAWAIGLS
jgi:hypothetical protein